MPEVSEGPHVPPRPFVMKDGLTLNIEVDIDENYDLKECWIQWIIIANDSSDQRTPNNMKSSIRMYLNCHEIKLYDDPRNLISRELRYEDGTDLSVKIEYSVSGVRLTTSQGDIEINFPGKFWSKVWLWMKSDGTTIHFENLKIRNNCKLGN